MRHAILAPHSAHRTFYKYDREASEASTEAADQEFINDHLIPTHMWSNITVLAFGRFNRPLIG